MRPLRARTLAALPALLLVATGCTSTAHSPAPDALRIAGPFEVHSLDPTADGQIFTRLQVAETLVTSDMEGEITPGLATGWTSSEDHTRWTFDLAEDVTFHDGSPMTAEAVVASLEAAAAQEASPLAGVPIEQIRADGSAVAFDLEEPYLSLPAVLTHYSTQVLAPASYEDGTVTSVLGTGPYQVEQVELPARIRTTRFDGWRGEAPEVEDVTFQAVSRPESRALMAASDQADVVFGLEPAGSERVEGAAGVRMESALQPRTILLKTNAAHPVLGDVRVRRALSLALDREAIAGAVLREEELAATQLLPPSLSEWHADVEPLEHDPDAAAELLSEAGWEPAAGGIRQKGGTPLTLTLTTYPDRPELPALATAIQAELRKVGVDLEVDVTNSSEVPARQADGSLELALIAKHFALVADPLIDVSTVFAPEGDDWGVMNWKDAGVTRAVNALLAGAEGEEAQAHRDTIVRTAQEQLPLVPVAWYRMNAAVNDRVEGFRMDPLETTWRLSDLHWAQGSR